MSGEMPTRTVRLTNEEAKAVVTVAKRRKRQQALIALALIILGTILLSVAAYGITGTFWWSCGIIGVILLSVGVLLGRNG